MTCNLKHSHAIGSDPFVFIQHREMDPGPSAAKALALVTPISIRSSSASSEDLLEAVEIYSTSQGEKAMHDEQRTLIFAEKIPPTASAI